jgi:hypothetical protein
MTGLAMCGAKARRPERLAGGQGGSLRGRQLPPLVAAQLLLLPEVPIERAHHDVIAAGALGHPGASCRRALSKPCLP